MDPVSVKVYGLFPLTRSRYLRQATAGFIALGLVFVAWWFGWPILEKRLGTGELPTWMRVTREILRRAHWLLLGVGAWKAVEMWFVLRAFARKEKSAAATGEPTSPPTTSSSPERT